MLYSSGGWCVSRNADPVLGSAGIAAGYPRPDLDTIHAKPHICIRIETLFESTLRSRAVAPRAHGEATCVPVCTAETKRRSFVCCTCTHVTAVCWLVKQNTTEQNRTERNGAERNRMKRNRSERSGEAQADCTAAACLLAHLGVLNLYVVSSTGSAISLSHWREWEGWEGRIGTTTEGVSGTGTKRARVGAGKGKRDRKDGRARKRNERGLE